MSDETEDIRNKIKISQVMQDILKKAIATNIHTGTYELETKLQEELRSFNKLKTRHPEYFI